MKANKYLNKKVIVDNICFDSIIESEHYLYLKCLLNNGVISELRMQVPFVLLPKQISPSGKKIRDMKYIADFVYIKDGKTIVADVKSKHTSTLPAFKDKAKLMLFFHNIEIEVIIY